jgi:hypothetical protein
MKQLMVNIQGKQTTPDINQIKQLLENNPSWGRTRLSQKLCHLWNWRSHSGQLKDMACRTLLLKLELTGCIKLPIRQRKSTNAFRNRYFRYVTHLTDQLSCSLKALLPLQVVPVAQGSDDNDLFKCLVSRYHYLGLKNTVGENIKYLVRDCTGRPVACLLFGSAAWKTKPRDSFIGWNQQSREMNLCYLTNNTRFLVLPWVRVPHLASHILSQVARRINSDWVGKYGHPVYLLETFVDKTRFHGTCYRAANWILTGHTKGRTRNDRNNSIMVPVKDVYVYPLIRNFRRAFCLEKT